MGQFDDILDEFENDLMKKEKINLVAFIVDASGSMNGSEKFVCDTFNEQLKIAKEQEDQETLITMVSFSSDVFWVFRNEWLGEEIPSYVEKVRNDHKPS